MRAMHVVFFSKHDPFTSIYEVYVFQQLLLLVVSGQQRHNAAAKKSELET